MKFPTQHSIHCAAIALLVALSLLAPLPLYLVSLALFGLPHVVCEIGYLRSRYAGRWPLPWWYVLWTVLLLQAAARSATLLGAYSSEQSRIVDALTLLLLVSMVALAPAGAGWRVRVAGAALGAGMGWLLDQGDLVLALSLLAIAHNFTPVAMAWDFVRDSRHGKGLAWIVTALFVLPWLVAASGWHGGIGPAMFADYAWAIESQLPSIPSLVSRQALLSALVLSQCLHYYCVIVLLPRAESQRTGVPVINTRGLLLLAVITLCLTLYFAVDFVRARQLYAIAAGMHAWLEWPLLIMALLALQTPGTRPKAVRVT